MQGSKMPSGDFADKVVLVVGAGTPHDGTMDAPGVGAAISIHLSRLGSKVVAVGLGPDGVARTSSIIHDEGGVALALSGDVSVDKEAERVVDEAVAWGGKIDVLVNNLGVRLSAHGVLEMETEEWDTVMDVNARGLVLVSRYAIPHMPAGSSIVNISSIGATRPTYKTSLVYAASKGAVNSLTTTMALQLALIGIRVNAVTPGNLWTPIAIKEVHRRKIDPDPETARERRRRMNPLELEGTGWDIANAVEFFAGSGARWITGQNLIVDGGALLPTIAAVKPQSESS